MLPIASLIGFLFLGFTFFSMWIRRDPRIWGSLLGLSLLLVLIGGTLHWSGLIVTIGWASLWIYYTKNKNTTFQFILFIALVILSFGFKFQFFPGFKSIWITPKFRIGTATSLLGLFPLALIVPLAKNLKDWKKVGKGVLIGILSIAILAIFAIASGAIHWEFKLPTFAAARYLNNFILVAIPEEAFYRGFLQNQLCKYLQNVKAGNIISLILTSIIFTLVHIYWSPSLAILGFVFLASLIYGSVYLISKKIESAILCHFLLNFIHMTFFSYHSM